MALSSEEIIQYMVKADEAFDDKAYNEAVIILDKIIKKNPNYAPSYRKMGSILMLSQSQDKALFYLNKAVELAPDDAENWEAVAHYRQRRGEWAQALRALGEALQHTEEHEKILFGTLQANHALGDLESAISTAEKLLQIDPQNIEYQHRYALLFKERGNSIKALSIYHELLEADTVSGECMEEWYDLMLQVGRLKEARNHLKRLSNASPKSTEVLVLYARSCMDDLDDIAAERAYISAIALEPDNITIRFYLAQLYDMLDEREKAAVHYNKILDSDPYDISALTLLYYDHHYAYGDKVFTALNKKAARLSEFDDKTKAQLHYMLGKAHDDVGDPATAFEHYKIGGALHSRDREQDEFLKLQYTLERAQKCLTRDFFEHQRESGHTSKKPVFIVGMPRSGTTLMEQVLSGIRGVYGAGELESASDMVNGMVVNGFINRDGQRGKYAFSNHSASFAERGADYIKIIERLAPESTKRIVDKMPQNFVSLGLIHLILPNASIIHARRHPVETCLSAYRIHFHTGHYWSSDLRMMGRYYRLYTELMAHWQSVLPEGSILNVRYEDMIDDLEGQSRRIATHINIPWDANCLNFHTSKNPVRTASISQVRKPIYKTSINRWRKYEPYLKPLLDEIWDIIEAYEAE